MPNLKIGFPPSVIEVAVDDSIFLAEEKTILTTIVDLGPGISPALLGTWKRIAPHPNAANWQVARPEGGVTGSATGPTA